MLSHLILYIYCYTMSSSLFCLTKEGMGFFFRLYTWTSLQCSCVAELHQRWNWARFLLLTLFSVFCLLVFKPAALLSPEHLYVWFWEWNLQPQWTCVFTDIHCTSRMILCFSELMKQQKKNPHYCISLLGLHTHHLLFVINLYIFYKYNMFSTW